MPVEDNGIPAVSYVPLLELDPPLAGQVLSLLADAGVAAYVEPAQGERGPYQDVHLPERVSVVLRVDRSRVEQARAVVSAELPQLRAAFLADSAARDDRSGLASTEVDAAWARIVAGYDAPADPVGRWSAAEDVDEDEPPARSGLSRRLVRRSDPQPDSGWDDGWDEPPDDPDDHYVPPPPPPLPKADGITRLAWAGVVGGPALILLIAVLGIAIEPVFVLLAVLAFCGGVGTLVWRMADRPRQDDGWDDGAVV